MNTPAEPLWRPPFDPRTRTVTLDFSAKTPGLMTYRDVVETDTVTGEVRRIVCNFSVVIPGGYSLTYPSHDTLMAHVALMRIHREKLEAFDTSPTGVAATSESAPPARTVFGRIGHADGRKLARQAAANAQGSLL